MTSGLILVWAGLWVATRLLMVVQVGFWNNVDGVHFQDVVTFESWSNSLAAGQMPSDDAWQYPPGAGFLMLIPRLGGAPFGESFVVMMLIFDLIGLGLIALLARRRGRNIGIWVWLLAMPLLREFPMLRFDLVPTVIGMATLVVIHLRPVWFGVLAGLGASIKVWPLFVLFGEWDRRRLVVSAVTALGVLAAVFGVAAVGFGDQSTFFGNQGVRGLQVESVASVPWHLRQLTTGEPLPMVPRNGTLEIDSGFANAAAEALKWLSVMVLAAAAAWWIARDRAIRAGRTDLTDVAISRDLIFTIVLLLVVTSRVLSPQFMIWLVGLAAVILTAGTARMARPAWIVVGAIVLTAGVYASPANNVIRNSALLIASIDAAIAMVAVLRANRYPLPTDARVSDASPHHRWEPQPE